MDTCLFFLINQGLQNTVLDTVMVFVTKNRFILFGAVLIPLFLKDWGKGLLVFTLCVAGYLIAGSSVSLLKNLFARPRPCHALDEVRLLIACLSSFSFPSGHAATSFAMASILGHFFKGAAIPALILAALVAYSRIHVGVHYPSDVIAGAVWGCIAAGIILIVHHRVAGHIKK